MQEQSQPSELAKASPLSWAVLARQYAVLSAEYSALRAEHQALQHANLSRRWRLRDRCRRAVRHVPFAQAGWRLLRRWLPFGRVPVAAAGVPEHTTPARAALAGAAWSRVAAVAPGACRIVYIGDHGPYEKASMRYRAHNLIEALALLGTPAMFVPEEDLSARFAEVMSHDVIVLVRRRWNPRIKSLI